MHTATLSDSLSVEQQFCLRLIGSATSPEPRAEVQHLASQVDWSRFMTCAPAPLYPYIGYCLTTHLQASPIPSRVRDTLARATSAHVLLHLQRRAALGQILQALASQQVPVLVLKGAVLAYEVYPQPWRRTMSDIDVLVPPERLTIALETLRSLGFQVPERYNVWRLTATTARLWADEDGIVLQRPGTRLVLEVHTLFELTRPPYTLGIEAAWARSVSVSLDGMACRTLHPEDFLMHLCVHLSYRHRFAQGLRSLLDIRLYLERHAAVWDWPKLATDCQQYGYAGWVTLPLHLARELLAAPIPESFFTAMPSLRKRPEVAALAVEQLWSRKPLHIPPGVLAQRQALAPHRLVQRFWRGLTKWCHEDMRGFPTPRRIARIVHAAALYVLKVQLVPWLRAWRQGELTRAQLDQAMTLRKRQQRIGELLAESSAALAPRDV